MTHILNDRNFDDLAERFEQRVYQSSKGDLRLQLIKEDLMPQLGDSSLKILDAGGGLGQMSRWLAEQGHQVTLVDLSREMLDRSGCDAISNIDVHHSSIQDFLIGDDTHWDVILCHAVMEWLIDPEAMIHLLASRLKPSGLLSVIYFNRNSLILRHAHLGNWDRLQHNRKGPYKSKGLTPQNPVDPDDFTGWWAAAGLSVDVRRGIRVFHDFIRADEADRVTDEQIYDVEKTFGVQAPWWQLARYIHMVGRI